MPINPTRKYPGFEWLLAALLTVQVADIPLRKASLKQAALQEQQPAEHEDQHTHQEENPYPFAPILKGEGMVSTATVTGGGPVIGEFPEVRWPH